MPAFHDGDHDATLDRVRAASDGLTLPPDARARIAQRLEHGAAGATTLRDAAPGRPRRLVAWAAAAAAVLVAFLLIPALDRSTTVSAAEILGRSQQALGETAHVIESLTYDLQVGGVLEELLPIEQSGRFTVRELVDHDHRGRYKIVKLGTDGRVVGAIAEDPAAGTRGWYFVTDGRGHLLRASGASPALLSSVGVRTFALQTLIGLMQASSSAALTETTRGGEPAYQIDVPLAEGQGAITLQRARAVVARADARLLDFDAAGAIGGRPFTITFNLRSRAIETGVAPDAFSLTAYPGDEVVDLPGSRPSDLVALLGQCLRQ